MPELTTTSRVEKWDYMNTGETEAESKELHGIWDPMPELTITPCVDMWDYRNTAGTEAKSKE
jgi:hypothetical protein